MRHFDTGEWLAAHPDAKELATYFVFGSEAVPVVVMNEKALRRRIRRDRLFRFWQKISCIIRVSR